MSLVTISIQIQPKSLFRVAKCLSKLYCIHLLNSLVLKIFYVQFSFVFQFPKIKKFSVNFKTNIFAADLSRLESMLIGYVKQLWLFLQLELQHRSVGF